MTAYIYVLKCPESARVRYVGKGVDLKARLRQHRSEARNGGKSHKCDWIRSLAKRGLRPVMEVDQEIPEGMDWKEVEVARIAHYRAQGCNLTNGTDGGDEPGELSEEGRKVLSARASQTFGSPEGRIAQSNRMKELCRSPEWLAARVAAGKAKRASPEYKARLSASSKARWADPEYRERMRQARQALNDDPNFRAKLSAGVTRAQAAPEVRAKIAERTRASWPARRQQA